MNFNMCIGQLTAVVLSWTVLPQHIHLACVQATVVSGGIQREATALVGTPTQLTVATFNVENLDAAEPDAKFNGLAAAIVNNLKSPDVIGIEEIQDNNGPTPDAVVDASATWNKLIAAIAAAGGPTYRFTDIPPVDDQDGGEPGGNIRVGYLYNPDRITFISRPGGTSTNSNTVVAGKCCYWMCVMVCWGGCSYSPLSCRATRHATGLFAAHNDHALWLLSGASPVYRR